MQLVPTTREHADVFGAYAYPEPYALHNSAAGSAEVFADPRARYFSVLDADELLGLCCFGAEARVFGASFGDDEPRILDVGIGMNPARTGNGHGSTFLTAVLAFARSEYAPEVLRATIAAFNVRSQRVFENAGFKATDRFERPRDDLPFLVFESPVRHGPTQSGTRRERVTSRRTP